MQNPPVLGETRHERTTAGLLSVVSTLTALVVVLGAVALNGMTVELPEQIVQIEFVELGPGDPGTPATDPQLETPDEPPAAELSEAGGTTESLDSLAELSADLSQVTARQFESVLPPNDSQEDRSQDGIGTTTKGSRSSLSETGCGGPMSPEQRWILRFDDSTLETYARQLDHFGIELGAFVAAQPAQRARLTYIRNVSSPRPDARLSDGSPEERLFLSWRNPKNSARDRMLLAKAGVDEPDAVFLLFLSAETERLIQQVEEDYRGMKASEIRRTYFRVVPTGDGFRFAVTSQSYLR